MRVIVRKERPHPGAQLRITDADGHRVTAFATNTTRGQLSDLELRHRRRARCEDRIRCAKVTGPTNLPLHGFDQNRIWCAVVALACDLLAWLAMLALVEHPARRWRTQAVSVPAAVHRRPPHPLRARNRPAPPRHRPMERTAHHRHHPAPRPPGTRRLTPGPPAPTTRRPRPDRGPGAHPSTSGVLSHPPGTIRHNGPSSREKSRLSGPVKDRG